MRIPRILASLALCVATVFLAAASTVDLVPKPLKVTVGAGCFQFDENTRIVAGCPEYMPIVNNFADLFSHSAGFRPATSVSGAGNIVLKDDNTLSAEEYALDVTEQSITIKASAKAGFFYGLQTLRQLLPGELESATYRKDIAWTVPALSLKDSPRFSYRGVLIDVARFFLPKKDLMKVIDVAAMLKINSLHLHLVDDTGWRIEIKKYPKLMQVGAWKVKRDVPFPDRANQRDGEETPVGGYYTQDDIRELVSYAADRNVDIIPEIEMPAHTSSSLAAYPHLACPIIDVKPSVLPGLGGRNNKLVYCAGNDSVFAFLEGVLDEVMDLFPSKYIHLGGDEANKTYWNMCPKCKARMETEGLKDAEELQGYFMERMASYVKRKGKTPMGWDELTAHKLPDDIIIYGWQGFGNAALKAAQKGHKFIMTPARVLYLIRYQGPQWFEPLTYFGNNTLRDVYNYEPIQNNWKPEYEKYLMGVQGSLWTEFCNAPEDVNYLLFPRLLALADIAWTPRNSKDWGGFLTRLDGVLPHLKEMGIDYAQSMFNLDHKVTGNGKGALEVELSCIRPDVEVRYTLDGSDPTSASALYSSAIMIKKSTTVKAATFKEGMQMGKVLSLPLQFNKATGRSVQAKTDRGYVFTNGLRGSMRHSDFEWSGWYNADGEFTVDLGKVTSVKEVILGTITNSGMGVHMPSRVEVYASKDGKNATLIAQKSHSQNEIFDQRTERADLTFSKLNTKARYITVKISTPGTCPPLDLREGQPSWMHFDEIIVR